MLAPVFDMSGAKVREVELPDSVFGVEPNRAVMHQALLRQLANARQGTHATLTRSGVKRTTRKMYRQKGTGNARHGSRTANLFVGGGVAHGPHPRSYRVGMPRQMRRLAMRSALSAKAADSAVVLLEQLELEQPKTKVMRDLVDLVCEGASTLVLLRDRNDAVERSIRNLPHVRYLRASYVNVRDVLGYERLLMSVDTLGAVVEHLGGSPSPETTDA
jgi:large subunit ribosomal protein L4